MAKPGIQVVGLRETVRTLEKMGVEVADLKASFKRIGNLVADEAKSLAPRLSGKLASTVKPSNTKNKSVVRAGGSLPYAGVIHYGWPARNIEPHPFLTDALGNKQGDLKDALDSELHGLIRKLDLD